MKSEIPIKFLTILLILDFSIGLGIVYQDEIIEILNLEDKDCERSKSYTFLGPKWQSFPIEYYIDATIPSSFREVIKDSFDVWDDLTPVIIFEQVLDPQTWDLFIDYAPLIQFEGAIGVTKLDGNDEFFSDGLIKNATLILNSQREFSNIEFSCEMVPLQHRGPFDIESITVHEIGHVLGLDHTVDEFATMYPYYIGSFQKTLSQGEIDGFFHLYDTILI